MGKTSYTGSWNTWLAGFEVGERRYLEVDDIESYPNMMRTVNAPKSRRPPEMACMEFKAEMFTAVAANKLGKIRYLMCIERVE